MDTATGFLCAAISWGAFCSRNCRKTHVSSRYASELVRLSCHCKGNRLQVQHIPWNKAPHFKSARVTSTLQEKTVGDSPSNGSVTYRKAMASTWESSSATGRVHTSLPCNGYLLLSTSIFSWHYNMLYLTRIQHMIGHSNFAFKEGSLRICFSLKK